MTVRLLALVLAFSAPARAGEAPPTMDLFDRFSAAWREKWREQRLFSRPTLYAVVADGDRPVLHASSASANSALVRPLGLTAPKYGRLKWQWRIAAPLTGNDRERTRAGDDYAARVCVIFEHAWLPLRTRSIHYVWAAHEPAGAVFPSPYSERVGMFVVRTGATAAGSWCREERDLIADYRRFFGQEPVRIDAVAILADSDNTERSAEAWFANLELVTARDPAP